MSRSVLELGMWDRDLLCLFVLLRPNPTCICVCVGSTSKASCDSWPLPGLKSLPRKPFLPMSGCLTKRPLILWVSCQRDCREAVFGDLSCFIVCSSYMFTLTIKKKKSLPGLSSRETVSSQRVGTYVLYRSSAVVRLEWILPQLLNEWLNEWMNEWLDVYVSLATWTTPQPILLHLITLPLFHLNARQLPSFISFSWLSVR